ncbi:stevor [Plasmodium sp. gorilla clade G1]|nr:stevor [Plasmodium sp. gorilla clade G1]
MLLYSLLFNSFLLSQNVNCRNNIDNVSLIHNNTQRTTKISRLLTEIQKPNNPHYHNDPELKEIIDKLNEEAIKKYQKTHEPYEQLQELVKKTEQKIHVKIMNRRCELLKTYEEMFDDESHIMLKWDIYSNDNNKSNDKNNRFGEYTNKKESSNKLSSSNKIHDNYLDNLKEACVAGVGTCSLSSIITGSYGVAAGTAAAKSVIATFPAFTTQITNALIGVKFFYISLLETTINAVTPTQFISFLEGSGTIVNAAGAGTAAFFPYGMAIVALIAITIIVIILYVWLRNRRKNSWKHECKKHLCT